LCQFGTILVDKKYSDIVW